MRYGRFLLCVCFVLLMAGCAKQTDNNTVKTLQDTQISVWRTKGSNMHFFPEAGVADTPYKVKYMDVPGGDGNLMLSAFISGDLDYSETSWVAPVTGVAGNVPIKLIGYFGGKLRRVGIQVPADSDIYTVNDLKGKKITYYKGSESHYVLLKVLENNGLTINDVVSVVLPQNETWAAFRRGHADAIVSWGIHAIKLGQEANLRWVEGATPDLYPLPAVLIASEKVLADPNKKEAIFDFIDRESKTWAWAKANPEQWAAKSEKLTGIPKDAYLTLLAGYTGTSYVPADDFAKATLQDIHDTFVRNGVITKPIAIEKLWE